MLVHVHRDTYSKSNSDWQSYINHDWLSDVAVAILVIKGINARALVRIFVPHKWGY